MIRVAAEAVVVAVAVAEGATEAAEVWMSRHSLPLFDNDQRLICSSQGGRGGRERQQDTQYDSDPQCE